MSVRAIIKNSFKSPGDENTNIDSFHDFMGSGNSRLNKIEEKELGDTKPKSTVSKIFTKVCTCWLNDLVSMLHKERNQDQGS